MTNKGPNKIKIHYGMPDYYKYYNDKYNNKVCSKKYNKIISEFNLEIINLIINENIEYSMNPLHLVIGVRKVKRRPRIVNGKLRNTVPIDWKTTKELWQSDEEAKEKKILVRFSNSHTSGYIFSINLIKVGLGFQNKKYYKFKASRKFARDLGERIQDEDKERYDTYKLY